MWSAIGNAIFSDKVKDYYRCPGGCGRQVWVVKGFPHVKCHVCSGR